MFTFAVDGGEDLVDGFGPDEGVFAVVQPLMKARILLVRSRTEVKVPRWMAWIMLNQISTWSVSRISDSDVLCFTLL